MNDTQPDFPYLQEADFGPVSALEVVRTLLGNNYTGRLVAKDGSHQKAIYVQSGQPVGAKSNHKPETLVRVARRRGLIDDEQFTAIVQEIESTGKLAGELMQEHGVSDAKVEQLLSDQTAIRFADLCRWKSGKYRWIVGLPEEYPRSGTTVADIFYEYADGIKKSPEFQQRVAKLRGQAATLALDRLAPHQSAISANPDYADVIEALRSHDSLPITDLVHQREDRDGQLGMLIGLYALILMNVVTVEDLGDQDTSTTDKPQVSVSAAPSTRGGRADEREDDPALAAKLAAMKGQDYFERLGVEHDADDRMVKRAYFKLAKEFHPDKFFDQVTGKPNRTAESILALINEAYGTLRNSTTRSRYQDLITRGTTEEEEMERAGQILESELEFKKATVLLKLRKYGEAMEHIQAAVDLYDEEPEYWIYHAWATFMTRLKSDPDAASEQVDLLKKLISEGKTAKHVDGWYFFGRMQKIVGDPAIAKSAFEHVLKLNKNHRDAAQELRVMES